MLVQAAGQHMSPLTHCMIWLTGLAHIPFVHFVPVVHPFWSSHAMPSLPGLPFAHFPAEHASPTVHGFLSSHGALSLPGMATQLFITSLHTPIMHTSPGGAHVFGLPLHIPFVHVSPIVQKAPSSHGVPSFSGFDWQPRTGSQTPIPQTLLNAEQSTGGPFVHMPPLQTPEYVQGSPSSHEPPSLPGALPHAFVASSQAPIWQASGDGQNFCEPPTHVPLRHASFSVQNIPSSQLVPSSRGVFWHDPLMHVPTLQTSSIDAQSMA
jgi:hypothetical protein